jgi:hypothetical protein
VEQTRFHFDFDKQLLDNIVLPSHITYKKMTIAKNWIMSSVNVEGRQSCLPTSPLHRIQTLPEKSGVFCQVGATGRSRTA